MAFDLHIQLIDPTEQRASSTFTWAGPLPILVDGLQKVANKWVKIFLTRKGSHPIRRQEGTDFAYLLGGNVDDPDTLQTSIIQYMDDATNQVKTIQAKQVQLPDNERLAAVNLLRFVRASDLTLDVWVQVTNVARQTLNVLIPYARSA